MNFNNISLQRSSSNCCVEEQKKLYDAQKHLRFSDPITAGSYLAYCNKQYCITISTVEGMRASDAKMTRNFCVILYHQELTIEVRESIQHSIGMCKMSA